MSCEYSLEDIYQNYGKKLEEILLDGVLHPSIPFPVYKDPSNFIADNSSYKGLLIWETNKYHKGQTLKDLQEQNGIPVNEMVGFFIIPIFGSLNFDGFEGKFTTMLHIDTNNNLDTFQSKQVKFVHWFINEHKSTIEDQDLQLPNRQSFVRLSRISDPIESKASYNFTRRTITNLIRYCIC